MAKMPSKFEWAIPSDLNTYAVREQLKAAGLRYGEGQHCDICWWVADEATWRAEQVAEGCNYLP